MKGTKSIKAFLMLVFLLFCLSGCNTEHSIVGTWKDTEENYTITFDSTGVYTDSKYGFPMEYSLKQGELLYYSAAGDMCYVKPVWGSNGNLYIDISGRYRELEPVAERPSYVFPDVSSVSSAVVASECYTLKSALPLSSELYLAENSMFAYSIRSSEVESADWHATDYEGLRGMMAKSYDQRHLILYYDQGEGMDVLPISEDGSYLGARPLTNDGELFVQKDYHNPLLGIESGYVLDGVVFDTENSTSYTFLPDSTCTKSAQGGDEIRYTYYIDTQGLVTLGSVEGCIQDDYMYYDASENRVYRLAYRRDSWYDFVSSTLATGVQSSNDEGQTATVMSLDYHEHLPIPYVENSNPLYAQVGFVDYEYTCDGAATIRDMQAQLQADDELRREHEAASLEEQKRFLKREQERAKERARVKAELNARMEAAIASENGVISSGNDAWLEDFISQLEQLDGYNPDEVSVSPGVDIGGSEFPVSGPSQPPVTATPTESNDPRVEESESSVPQYDPEFHIDFVCTCVNCHVSSLPVELGADNILLVDASVIAPGTHVNVEGYGMVTTRASGGITSGQTAICYSKSHNAVN